MNRGIKTLLAIAAFSVLFAFSSCPSPLSHSSDETAETAGGLVEPLLPGMGRLCLRLQAEIAEAARSTIPAPHFTRYVLSFTCVSNESFGRDDVELWGVGEAALSLEPGTWTVNVSAYAGPAGNILSGQGGAQGVVIDPDSDTQLSIRIASMAGTAQGRLNYEITLPPGSGLSDYSSITLTVTRMDGSQAGGVLDIRPANPAGQTVLSGGPILLDPGSYFAHFILEDEVRRVRAGWTSSVHIYPAQDAVARHTFSAEEFEALIPLEGNIVLTINLPPGQSVVESSKLVLAYSDENCLSSIPGAQGLIGNDGRYRLFSPASYSSIWLRPQFQSSAGALIKGSINGPIALPANAVEGLSGVDLVPDVFYSITAGAVTGGGAETVPASLPGKEIRVVIEASDSHFYDGYTVTWGAGTALDLEYVKGSYPPEFTFTMPQGNVTLTPSFILQTAAVDALMVPVPVPQSGLSFPTGTDDGGTASVSSGYGIGKTEITWELWNTVRVWAQDEEGYSIAAGGMGASDLEEPGTPWEPVTGISWYDAAVWCNALTEWLNEKSGSSLTPVYYNDAAWTSLSKNSAPGGFAKENAAHASGAAYIKPGTDGYRLPLNVEWELAARWQSADNGNTVAGYSNPWFTRGNSAAGASGPLSDAAATGAAALYAANSGGAAGTAAGKAPNGLGLYGMSGNVREWCWDWLAEGEGASRALRGGGWRSDASACAVGAAPQGASPEISADDAGFRPVRGPGALEIPVTLVSALADGCAPGTGTDGLTSTTITLRFDKDIAGFSAGDITLGPGTTWTTKGSLSRLSEGVYELSLNRVLVTGTVTLGMSRPGYAFVPPQVDVDVYRALPSAAQVLAGMVEVTVPPGGITVPAGADDSETVRVERGFKIGSTEVTWELWDAVKIWALENGYTFAASRSGAKSDNTGNPLVPVGDIDWYNAAVWCNALTEWVNAKTGSSLGMVYYYDEALTLPCRNSNFAQFTVAANGFYLSLGSSYFWYGHAYVKVEANGFRLPHSAEWELAARRQNTDNGNTVAGYSNPWFTKGNSASGAATGVDNTEETGLYAVFGASKTAEAGSRQPNALGLYDMSGNVGEWVYEYRNPGDGTQKQIRGGYYSLTYNDYKRLGYRDPMGVVSSYNYTGLRLALGRSQPKPQAQLLSITADGSLGGKGTTKLTVTFDQDVPDVRFYRTPASLGGKAVSFNFNNLEKIATGVYELPITRVYQSGSYYYLAADGTLTITPFRDYWDFSPQSRNVDVYKEGSAAFTGLTANGSPSAATTQLTLTFDKDIEDFGLDDITITAMNGLDPGTLTRTGTGVYQLAVSNIGFREEISLKVEKAGYRFSQDTRTAAVYAVLPTAVQAEADMVLVPVPSGGKSFPTGTNDAGIGYVGKAYRIGKSEVTWELWDTVRAWALGNGYVIPNAGRRGSKSDGSGGPLEPVTWINWYDMVVWCNAFTEWVNSQTGKTLSPVYYYDSALTTVAKDSSNLALFEYNIFHDEGGDVPYTYPQAFADPVATGYRLPTHAEWELAARWSPTQPANYFYVSGYSNPWFTKGDGASGATQPARNYSPSIDEIDTLSVTGKSKTANVKSKLPNYLGIYDMTGNVFETCYDWAYGDDPNERGQEHYILGASYWNSYYEAYMVGYFFAILPQYVGYSGGDTGFRLVKTE
jgi:formylglycine-generating enzyme required for sulfatase activity